MTATDEFGFARLRPRRRGGAWSAWGFVAFPLTIVFLFTALPSVMGIALSFFEWSGGGRPRFVGPRNYADLARDPVMWAALRNTAILALASVPATTALAFLFAAALHARWFVGRALARTLFFLPAVVSIVAIGFVWKAVLAPKVGLLDQFLLGSGWFEGGDTPDWLGNSPLGLATITAVTVWRGLGFAVVLYLAAMSNVPASHYDAAAVDGAGAWQTLRHVTWPGVSVMTKFLLVTGAIGALQVFDIVFVMVGRDLAQPWTDVLNLYLYREYDAGRLGFAAAIGVLVLVLTLAVTIAQFVMLKRATDEGTEA